LQPVTQFFSGECSKQLHHLGQQGIRPLAGEVSSQEGGCEVYIEIGEFIGLNDLRSR
jgi:hypothetical protein